LSQGDVQVFHKSPAGTDEDVITIYPLVFQCKGWSQVSMSQNHKNLTIWDKKAIINFSYSIKYSISGGFMVKFFGGRCLDKTYKPTDQCKYVRNVSVGK
jgi:hypothetical protein